MYRYRTAAVLVVLMGFLLGAALPIASAEEIAVPDTLGVGLDGKPVFLKDYLGKENLCLVFWTTWCQVCEDSIPNFIDIHKNVKAVRLVAINPGIHDSFERMKRYQKKFRLPYQVVFDRTMMSARAFDVIGVPMAVLINKQGEVVYLGFPPSSEEVSRYFE